MFLMKKIRLTLNLEERVLSINGYRLSLSDNLFSAELTRIIDSDQTALSLRYTVKRTNAFNDEGEKITEFVKRQGLLKDAEKGGIEIYMTPYSCSKKNPVPFPSVSLVGYLQAKIYNFFR